MVAQYLKVGIKYIIMKSRLFIVSVLSFIIFSCKTTEDKVIRKNIPLTQKQYNIIKKDKEISNGLLLAIKDSVKTEKINDALSIYFENKNKKELTSLLELLRVFKGSNATFKTIPTDSIDMSKAIIIDSYEDLKKFKKRDTENMNLLKENFNKAKPKVIIDSTIIKKDSLN